MTLFHPGSAFAGLLVVSSTLIGCAHRFGPDSARERALIAAYGEPDVIVEYASYTDRPFPDAAPEEAVRALHAFESWDQYVQAYECWPGGMMASLPTLQDTMSPPPPDYTHVASDWWYLDSGMTIRLTSHGEPRVIKESPPPDEQELEGLFGVHSFMKQVLSVVQHPRNADDRTPDRSGETR